MDNDQTLTPPPAGDDLPGTDPSAAMELAHGTASDITPVSPDSGPAPTIHVVWPQDPHGRGSNPGLRGRSHITIALVMICVVVSLIPLSDAWARNAEADAVKEVARTRTAEIEARKVEAPTRQAEEEAKADQEKAKAEAEKAKAKQAEEARKKAERDRCTVNLGILALGC